MHTVKLAAKSILTIEVDDNGIPVNIQTVALSLDNLSEKAIQFFTKEGKITQNGCKAYLQAAIAGIAGVIFYMDKNNWEDKDIMAHRMYVDLKIHLEEQKGYITDAKKPSPDSGN